MYQSFYRLKKPPFESESDRTFLWMGKKYSRINSSIENALLNGNGTLVVSGQDGLGKSTLLNHIKNNLEEQYVVISIENRSDDIQEVFNELAFKLNIRRQFFNKSEFLVLLRNKLQSIYNDHKKLLLIVDDADLFKVMILKELHMLSMIQMNEQPLVQILFAGSLRIYHTLLKFEDGKMGNFNIFHQELMPLSQKETAKYIRHRLEIAGSTRMLFKDDALKKIFINSRGIPKSINTICDLALTEGFKLKKKHIKADVVNRCARLTLTPSVNDQKANTTDAASQPLDSTGRMPRNTRLSTVFYTVLALGAIIIFISFTVYYYYEFIVSEITPWKIEEIAPKENPLINERIRKKELAKEMIVSTGPPNESSDSMSTNDVRSMPETGHTQVPPKEMGDKSTIKPEAGSTEFLIVDDKIIVNFRHDSNDLSASAYDRLNDLASKLQKNPGLNLIVRGYTDSSGLYGYNIAISKNRAEAVANYLVARGVRPERIESFGMGPTNFLMSNSTEEGRRFNRRVEIEVVPRIE